MPTEPCVQNLSAGQQLLLEYGFRRLDQEQWQRVERTLGTLWEWTDVYNSKTGRPLEEADSTNAPPTAAVIVDESELRLPLALVLKPELLQLLRKRLRPPAHLRRSGAGVLEGSEMEKQEFLDLFGGAVRSVPAAAAAIQEQMQPKKSFTRGPGPPLSRPRVTHQPRPTMPPATSPANITRKPPTPR